MSSQAEEESAAHLEKRLGRVHARLRLGLEADHEAQVFGHGANYFHFENLRLSHTLIGLCLKATGTSARGRRNAAALMLQHNHIYSTKIAAAFNGYSILHLSDLHIEISQQAISRLRELLPTLDYDICVLTGDYRAQTHGPYEEAMEGLRAVIEGISRPIYGVLGNHDSVRMLPSLESMGVSMLMNENIWIERNGVRMLIAGIDDAHFYQADNIENAAAGMLPDQYAILLSHTPEVYQQAAHAEFDLMLSGHTHGGQICLPGGIPVTLDSALPRGLGRGPWHYHNLVGYTSAGLGTSIVTARFNCPPEITLHHLWRLH